MVVRDLLMAANVDHVIAEFLSNLVDCVEDIGPFLILREEWQFELFFVDQVGGAYPEQPHRRATCQGDAEQFHHRFVDQDVVICRFESDRTSQSLKIGIA